MTSLAQGTQQLADQGLIPVVWRLPSGPGQSASHQPSPPTSPPRTPPKKLFLLWPSVMSRSPDPKDRCQSSPQQLATPFLKWPFCWPHGTCWWFSSCCLTTLPQAPGPALPTSLSSSWDSNGSGLCLKFTFHSFLSYIPMSVNITSVLKMLILAFNILHLVLFI